MDANDSHTTSEQTKTPHRSRADGALAAGFGLLLILAWQLALPAFGIPQFVLPTPLAIWNAFISDAGSLMSSLGVTLYITMVSYLVAVIGGIAIALMLSSSATLEKIIFPYAVVLQVTPIVAIAPLVLIWVGLENVNRALVILATLVAFFPVLTNAMIGLRSADRGLQDLFKFYSATKWQRFWKLQLPSSLPYLLSGMKVSGGLALIGAVVAEFVAGSGTSTGLAWRIIEAGNRLNVPKMFAALLLLSICGIVIHLGLSALERMCLRSWHESAVKQD